MLELSNGVESSSVCLLLSDYCSLVTVYHPKHQSIQPIDLIRKIVEMMVCYVKLKYNLTLI